MFIAIPVLRICTEAPIFIADITILNNICLQNNTEIPIGNMTYPVESLARITPLKEAACCFAIYQIDNLSEDQLSSEHLLERLIHPVDLAVDCLRFDFNSYQFYEQSIGAVGILNGSKTIFVLDNTFELRRIISNNTNHYNLSEGLGSDISTYHYDKSHMLLQQRTDEVYLKYRNILHRLLKSIQVYDVDTCFTFLFSTLEGLDCIQLKDFPAKKKRLLAFVSPSQEYFDILSNQLYFYSKVVRTDVVHSGQSLYDFLPWQKTRELLDNLSLLIIKFCTAAINCNASDFSTLNNIITNQVNKFKYTQPSNIAIHENKISSNGKCLYFARINNLVLDTLLKIGHLLIVPNNSTSLILKIQVLHTAALKFQIENNLEETEVIINEQFPNSDLIHNFNIKKRQFTLWDIDLILTTLLRGVTIPCTFAILENQPYYEQENNQFDFQFQNEFADIICNTIQKELDHLTICESFQNDVTLPSKVGVNSAGIRAAFCNPNNSSSNYCLNGRIFGMYSEHAATYTPDLSKSSDIIYNYYCSTNTGAVFSSNKRALSRLSSCVYLEDINEKFISIFDCLDMLNPSIYNGEKLIKQIAIFSSETLDEKNKVKSNLTKWKKTIRNPLFHEGKSIQDLGLTLDEAFSILNEIRKILIRYCENVYILDIQNFEDLKEAQANRLIYHFTTHCPSSIPRAH